MRWIRPILAEAIKPLLRFPRELFPFARIQLFGQLFERDSRGAPAPRAIELRS